MSLTQVAAISELGHEPAGVFRGPLQLSKAGDSSLHWPAQSESTGLFNFGEQDSGLIQSAYPHSPLARMLSCTPSHGKIITQFPRFSHFAVAGHVPQFLFRGSGLACLAQAACPGRQLHRAPLHRGGLAGHRGPAQAAHGTHGAHGRHGGYCCWLCTSWSYLRVSVLPFRSWRCKMAQAD